MKNIRKIEISLSPHPTGKGRYVATYEAGFQQAVFSVTVKDNIFGALALYSFAEMVRKQFGPHYTTGEVEFIFPDCLQVESKPLKDVLVNEKAFCG
ncbi:MAG: hypothetical protein DRP87_20005 [Spirochaetes bacterium]|nr:MAG: hypothetical protein DRP87_20005 [Spirochaetota bacterium]